jgi:hypothetical protein
MVEKEKARVTSHSNRLNITSTVQLEAVNGRLCSVPLAMMANKNGLILIPFAYRRGYIA